MHYFTGEYTDAPPLMQDDSLYYNVNKEVSYLQDEH